MATTRFGARSTDYVDNMAGGAPPVAATDDVTLGYIPGSVWVDLTNDKVYVCTDNTNGAAVWKDITAVITVSAEVWGGITNAGEDRAFDADATSIDELADVLGTLVADLITTGIIVAA